MPYKYLPTYLSILPSNPGAQYANQFQQTLNVQFSNASDAYTIKEETVPGSGVYKDILVRVNSVIQSETGFKLGDDFKNLLFPDINHPTGIGRMYYFDNNYWISIFTDSIKSLTTSCMVRRCNNVLRWQDADTGALYSIPVIFDTKYLIRMNRNYTTSGSAITLPAGFVDIVAQFNSISNKIRPNQRFLIGNPSNWASFIILGGGVNNFSNQKTNDNMSAGIIEFTAEVNFTNPDTDDLVNGIADVLKNVYSITLNQSNVTGAVGDSLQLSATIKFNGDVVDRNVTWKSSDPSVATVSNTGAVSMLASGSAVITCALANNPAVNATTNLTVTTVAVDYYEVRIVPDTNYLLEGQTQVFQAYLYKNNVLQADTFTFSFPLTNNAPIENYIFTEIDGNTFSVKNLSKYLNNPLTITCSTPGHSLDFGLWLKGAW